LILTKLLLYTMCVLLPLMGWSQPTDSKKLKHRWTKIHEEHGFRRSKEYTGPASDNYIAPTSINENQPVPQGSSNAQHTPYNGMPYSSSQQQRGRNPGGMGPGGPGSMQADPDVTPPEEIDVPELDAPDIDAPDIDPPSISSSFWNILGIIILIFLVALILYFILKNRQPSSDSAIPFEPLEENLNPATISKTELEMRLEEAMYLEDYRECVRIYFLFAMKELIQRRWIFWKKEKTNIHYILEMQGRPTSYQFEEIVGIYDLVWYGDYHIDKEAYFNVQPKLDNYYKLLQSQP
jgi:hypothetical protein